MGGLGSRENYKYKKVVSIMIDYIIHVLIIGLSSVFVLIVLDKWKATEWLQVHGNKFFSKMAGCSFCLSFWVALAISLILSMAIGDFRLLFAPIITSPLTRYMI